MPRGQPRRRFPGAAPVYICRWKRESAVGDKVKSPAGSAAEPRPGPEMTDLGLTILQGAGPPCRVAIIVTSSSDPARTTQNRLGQKGRVPSLHKPQRARGTCVGRRDARYMVKRNRIARKNIGRRGDRRRRVALAPQPAGPTPIVGATCGRPLNIAQPAPGRPPGRSRSDLAEVAPTEMASRCAPYFTIGLPLRLIVAPRSSS